MPLAMMDILTSLKGASLRKYYLPHSTGLDALHQRVYLNIRRPDTIHRRYQATQHMIQSVVLLCILYGHHILDILYHADGLCIAARIAADGARIAVADIVAHMTVFHFLLQPPHGIGKLSHIVSILPQQVKHQPQSRLISYARQF